MCEGVQGHKDMLAFIKATQILLKDSFIDSLNKTYLATEAYKGEIKTVESEKPGFNSRFANLLMV